MDIGILRPATITLTIVDVIMLVKMIEVYVGRKIPATISLSTVEFIILVLMVEV